MRVGVLTGGGDCPGLNAVIRAVVKAATHCNCEVLGLDQLLQNRFLAFRGEVEGARGVVEECTETRGRVEVTPGVAEECP